MAARTVLHLIETGGPGGAERMMVRLAAGLAPAFSSEVGLIRDSWLGNALRSRGIPVTMLRSNSEGSLAILRKLLRLIRKKRVRVIHTHEFFMNTLGLVASRVTGVPLVATVHGRNYYPDRFRRRAAYRLVARYGGRMVAVSEDIRHFLSEQVGISPERIGVVPNGVPLDEDPPQQRMFELRRELGIERHNRIVGTVGSLYPVKGHSHLMDAMVPIARNFPHVVSLIVGRGGLREELEAQARRLGIASHVRFLGHRDDVRDLLALCEVFALPSLSEGMPLALLEAMAAGVPPVATRVGGISEVVTDRETGLLIPPADSGAIAQGIMTLLANPALAKKIGESAREVVTGRFSLPRMVRAYQEIYAELLRERNGGRG